MRVLVFTATYNEASNVVEWHRRVRATCPDADLLVIDDSSPDGTGEELVEIQATDPRLTIITRQGKCGVGSAHRDAITYSLARGYDVLATLDADLSHSPELLPALIAQLPEFDFVIGTRSRAGSSGYEGYRKLIGLVGNWSARILIPTGLSEYTTSFRAFSPRALRVLENADIREDGYAYFVECVFVLHQRGCRLTEIPIHLTDRTKGRSKIPKNQIWLSASSLVRLALRRFTT